MFALNMVIYDTETQNVYHKTRELSQNQKDVYEAVNNHAVLFFII